MGNRLEPVFQPRQRLGIFFQLAFPDDQDGPIASLQRLRVGSIPSYVFLEFVSPELRSGFGSGRISATGVTMPEAAMDKNAYLEAWNHNVRIPRKVLSMQAISVPSIVQESSDQHFGSGILPSDARHHPGASC